MSLVDSHCHLDFEDFSEDFDAVLARAADAGVTTMQTICTRVSQFEKVRDIADAHANIWCSVGIHPHNVGEEPEVTPAHLEAMAAHPKVIGIGETGLDNFYDHGPRDLQERSFRAHIAAARSTGLPVIVHTRNADSDTCRILREEAATGVFPGVIHCFSTGREVAETAIELGLYVSLAGILTFKNAADLRDTVRDLPLDRLLVETDAPYLAPVPNRGKRNEPSFVRDTAVCVATVKDIEFDDVARETTNNFFRLFSKASPPTVDNQ